MNTKWLLQIRGQPPREMALALGLLPLVALGAIWFFVTWGEPEQRVAAPAILPSPMEVIGSVPQLVLHQGLSGHILASLRRVALAFLLALGITLPLGILMGSFGSVRAMFSPVTTASGYVPIAALVPLTLAWFGLNEKQKVAFLAIAFAISLIPQIITAVESVPDVYLRTAYTLGASRMQMIFRVLIPVAAPDIWRSMRVAFGVGWTYLVLAEVIGAEQGLGYFIYLSQRRAHPEHVYLTIIIITLIAWLGDLLWGWAGDWLFQYKRRRA